MPDRLSGISTVDADRTAPIATASISLFMCISISVFFFSGWNLDKHLNAQVYSVGRSRNLATSRQAPFQRGQ
jgi:hypothetical protein